MSEPRRHPHLKTALRFLCIALALPCVYFGAASGAFFYRHHARAGEPSPLPLAPAPDRETRLLVFAPHCDDETLGNAGRIQQTVAAGGAVRVVFLTNGDGFRTAVERQVRDVRVEPADYIQFAQTRQQEAVRALASLRLAQKDVLFLGYPDRGLLALWNDHWMPTHPYLSSYTQCSHSPYPNTFDTGAVYCGRDVTRDIEAAMRAFHPTLITVTHPAEDHSDHAAAAAFVARALQELQSDPAEASWAGQAHLEYYLVHRGDWPLPQGRRLTAALTPPQEMEYVDTRWKSLPLTPAETARKAKTIDLYETQTALMGRFLEAFARRTELFGSIEPTRLATVRDGLMRMDADAKDWESLPPALLDPVRDNVLRDLQGGGDIRTLYACRDSRKLYLRLDTRQPISSRMTYLLRLRAFGPNGETSESVTTLSLRAANSGATLPNGERVAIRGRILEASVPWDNLARQLPSGGIQTLAVSAETLLAGIGVDKTGVRFLNVH